jgi:rhodanese-related sulfurtransferase
MDEDFGHIRCATRGISIPERNGYSNLVLLAGGYSGWHTASYPEVRVK